MDNVRICTKEGFVSGLKNYSYKRKKIACLHTSEDLFYYLSVGLKQKHSNVTVVGGDCPQLIRTNKSDIAYSWKDCSDTPVPIILSSIYTVQEGAIVSWMPEMEEFWPFSTSATIELGVPVLVSLHLIALYSVLENILKKGFGFRKGLVRYVSTSLNLYRSLVGQAAEVETKISIRRVLINGLWYFSLVIFLSRISGLLLSSLTGNRPLFIDTFEDVLAQPDLPFHGDMPAISRIREHARTEPFYQVLADRLYDRNSLDSRKKIDLFLSKKSFLFVLHQDFLYLDLNRRNLSAQKSFYVSSTKYLPQYLYLFQPEEVTRMDLMEEMNYWFLRYFETQLEGCFQLWTKRTISPLVVTKEEFMPSLFYEIPSVDLKTMRNNFMVLAFGLSASVVVMIGEKIHQFNTSRRNRVKVEPHGTRSLQRQPLVKTI